ncbi:DNA-binding response regulator [Pseudomonas gingeri NCPPB 3146 = LMG 5327]|uniref:Response regulator transcription factor n=2 Tax=Pseudomonas gingeri TaxID=117681 RepID=A0A7Y8CEC1_9PSED|nr:MULTISPECIES: response regulator transcription factor [Pseudomonas]NVZ27326.1 response regulator transcription factor [Pseudomonas gingeri]NVZ63887.1 response regulator transcription factor [Pseudomonas gingeri]NVZ77967.1 response regulator transcription factor [Pseudomonas gingeri]NWA07568.1 response regulator transcription factor [Pseudomonas gingeri]NWC15042.1 response regulator transcription factor [Pseudomonas gingeri]
MSSSPHTPLRIALADDHPIFLIGLRAVLERDPGLSVVGEASTPQALFDLLGERPCDVLITDFMMPTADQNDGLKMIEALVRHYPDLPILVVTMLNNAGLFRYILDLGVMGLLSKASLAAELPVAIRHVRQRKVFVAQSVRQTLAQAGETGTHRLGDQEQLSPRELEVTRLLAAGRTVGEIAARLCRSKQTVSAQKVSAMRKLGLSNDAALFLYLQEHGLS